MYSPGNLEDYAKQQDEQGFQSEQQKNDRNTKGKHLKVCKFPHSFRLTTVKEDSWEWQQTEDESLDFDGGGVVVKY